MKYNCIIIIINTEGAAIMKRWIIVMLIAVTASGCSYLVRKPADMKKMAKGDGFVLKERVEHIPNDEYVMHNSDNGIRVFLRTKTNDIEECFVLTKSVKEKMVLFMTKDDYDYFYGDIDEIDEKSVSYLFEIRDAKSVYYKGEKIDTSKKGAGVITYKLKTGTDKIPAWVSSGIWYKIFVDRYRNGNTDNDPIFSEAGPWAYSPPEGTLSSGHPKRELISADRWSSDSLENYGEFKTNSFYSPWRAESEWEKRVKKEKTWYENQYRHYGGDFAGLSEKLDYIVQKGYTVISLSPVFYSYSNHKYDAGDMRHIDPSFGIIEQTGKVQDRGAAVYSVKGDSEYKLLEYNIETEKNGFGESMNEYHKWSESDIIAAEFNKAAHEKGLKVVYDVDITCVGSEFFPFVDIMRNGPKSKYRDWFLIEEWEKYDTNRENEENWNNLIEYKGKSTYNVVVKGDKKYRRKWIKPLSLYDKESIEWNIQNTPYKAWNGVKGVPMLNLANKNVKEYIINSLGKWIKGYSGDGSDGIDGLILLSTEKADVKVIGEIKTALAAMKKDLFVGGEIFVDFRSYVTDGILDGSINYGLMPPLLKIAVNTDGRYTMKAGEYKNEIIKGAARVSDAAYKGYLNHIGSQDSERIFSAAINLNREFDTLNRNSDKFRNIRPDLYSGDAVNMVKIITGVQFTTKGVPVVYYGDEVGMWGGDDPYNRKPMLWEDELKNYPAEEDELIKYKDMLTKFGKEVGADEANGVIIYPQKTNEEIQKWYDKLIKMRKEEREVIEKGKLAFIMADDANEIIGYLHYYNKKGIATIINCSGKNRDTEPEKEITIDMPQMKGQTMVDMVTNERFDVVDGKIKIKIPKKSIRILIKK